MRSRGGGSAPGPVLAPLLPAQRRIWFLEKLEPNAGRAYHLAWGLHLHGLLDRDALGRALDWLAARHGAFRTTIREIEGEPVQVIAARAELPIGEVAAEGWDTEAIDEFLAAEASRPIDLATGPASRCFLFRLRPDRHILAFVQHHAVTDGWSIALVARELGALYAAFCTGRPDPLPPSPLDMAQYATSVREAEAGRPFEADAAFWRETLADAPALLTVPTIGPRPSPADHCGGHIRLTLEKGPTDEIRRCGIRHGVTPFMVVLAAWALVLSRAAGQADVVVGTAVAGRSRPDLMTLVGFLANTLALRVHVEDQMTVRAYLEHVRNVVLDSFEHQAIPFDRVVETVAPQRGRDRGTIFNTFLAFENARGVKHPFGALAAHFFLLPLPFVQTDLALSLRDTGEAIEGHLTYATALFSSRSASLLADRFRTVVASLAANSEAPLGNLETMTADEIEAVLTRFNATEQSLDPRELVHHGVEASARTRPDAVAVLFEGHTVSYADLDRRADRLASRLAALGVKPDDRIALHASRCPGMIIGMLGILKAGAAYVPLDPALPVDRLAYVLEDSTPIAVVTVEAAPLGSLPESIFMIALDQLGRLEAGDVGPGPQPRHAALDASRLAYVLHTSGTTGRPKGVMIEHRSVVNFLRSMQCEPGIASHDRMLAVTTLAFDIAVLEIFLPLLAGATIVLATVEQAADPTRLADLIASSGATMMQATPATWRSLIDSGWAGCPGLRVLCGGEALPADLAHALAARVGEVWNLYGPTETTVWSTCCRVKGTSSSTIEPIGSPIGNTTVYLLSSSGQPVPIGTPGAIHIGGAGLARGYLNKPDLTAERFVQIAVDRRAPVWLYRTGDIGRWTPDGTLEFLGRDDFQIKLRGFRIEPGEIEATLREDPGISEAVVVARRNDGDDDRLVAYIVPVGGVSVDVARLKEGLARRLPSYMVPGTFVILDALPMTPNRKIDRKALPEPTQADTARPEAEEPRTRAEIALAAVWRDVLKIDRVTRQDSFFELGGHSLLAVRLVARIAKNLRLKVSVRDVFAKPTLRELAAIVEDGSELDLHPNVVPVRLLGSEPPLFLVHPGEGQTAYALSIAPWISPDTPVYGLAATGFGAGEAPLTSVEAMAELYEQAIRSVWPNGPMRLAGWSAGGIVAYEIARRMSASGTQVEFLGLIDTYSDYEPLTRAAILADTPADSIDPVLVLSWLPDGPAQGSVPTLREPSASAMLAACHSAGLVPAGVDLATIRTHWAVRDAITQAVAAYNIAPPPCHVVLFTAKDEHRADPSVGWQSIASGHLTVVAVPGTHYSIVRPPHAEQLGRAIGAALKGRGSA